MFKNTFLSNKRSFYCQHNLGSFINNNAFSVAPCIINEKVKKRALPGILFCLMSRLGQDYEAGPKSLLDLSFLRQFMSKLHRARHDDKATNKNLST